MSVLNQYQRFLASPAVNKNFLADNASFHYITSGVSINSADAIIKALQVESRQINKRIEKVISSVATADALVLEVETEFEFVTSGANYLPGLDDNFLADHVVLLPIIHFVGLKNGQVTQVRLFWDQSTLLKQLEVIGRTGRNWPIKDGKDQVLMIRRSVEAQGFSSSESSAPAAAANGNAPPARTAETTQPAQTAQPTQSGPSTRSSSPKPEYNQGRIRNDPRTSLNLYGGDEEDVARPVQPRGNSGYRPPSRDLAAIIGDDSEEQRSRPTQVVPPKARSSFSRGQSFDVGEVIGEANDAHNNRHIPPKGQTSMMKGQTFSLGSFDEDDQEPTPKAQGKGNVNSKKYAHFDFGNGEDAPGEPQITAKPKHAKHGSSWNFEDFSTPEKKPVQRRGDTRQFGWSDDEEAAQQSHVNLPKKTEPRKDNQPQFSPQDNGRSAAVNNRPLTNISNTQTQAQNNAQRNDGHHFEIADNSPANNKRAQKVQHNDDEDNFFSQMSSTRTERGIRIAGNGQGNRKDPNNQTQAQSNAQRNDGHFDIGYNSPEDTKRVQKVQHNDDEDNFFSQMSSTRTEAGIRIAGNGQGNRKATESHWGHGDNSPRAPMPGKQQRVEAEKEKDTSGGGFWDY